MFGDCHVHMILDGVYYRDAIDRHKEKPEDALIRRRLADYQKRGITYIRDGGDRWGVGLRASRLAPEYGIAYRTPVFNICRKDHYGGFLGRSFSDFAEYKALVQEVKERGGHFVKIMVSGLMDFNRFGTITDTPCPEELCRDLISYAHDQGFAVMAHSNGVESVTAALKAGADSIEHGAYLNRETLERLAQSDTVWVPTAVTIGNLRGLGRYPDEVLDPLLALHLQNVAEAAALGANIALGTDSGAYAVYHGQAVEEEYRLLRSAMGSRTDQILLRGQEIIQEKF